MIEVHQTEEFSHWVRRLKDANAGCPDCLPYSQHGAWQLGRSKNLRGGLMEMRIDYGPGYRVYYVRRGAGDRDPAVCRR
jgi:putative addiction module killer protein